jgi:hypothetical protein
MKLAFQQELFSLKASQIMGLLNAVEEFVPVAFNFTESAGILIPCHSKCWAIFECLCLVRKLYNYYTTSSCYRCSYTATHSD